MMVKIEVSKMGVISSVYSNGYSSLYHGDNREVLKSMPIESVQCVVTSPPYWGLRDYQIEGQLGLEPTPEEYVANMVEVFREVWRVLNPTGTVWLNLGDSYAGSTSLGRNDVDRKYPGSINKGLEAVHGTRQMPNGLKPKDLVGIPWRVAFALQADGWYLRSDIIWSKPNPMPESVTDRPTKAHEYIFLLTKSQRYYYDADAIREPSNPHIGQVLSNRESGTGKATGLHGQADRQGNFKPDLLGQNKRSVWEITTQPYSEAHFATYPEKLVEPCILAGTPEKGVCAECKNPWEREILLTRSDFRDDKGRTHSLAHQRMGKQPPPEKGWKSERETIGWKPMCGCNANTVPATVLDPFVGSGTTCAVSQRLGRHSIGIDASAECLELAKKRIGSVSLPMFA